MAARLGGREACGQGRGPARMQPAALTGFSGAIQTARQAVKLLPTHHEPCPPHLGCEGSTGAPRPGDDQSPPSRAALAAAAAGRGAAAAAASSAAEAGSRASTARREGAGATSSERAVAAAGGGWRRRPAPAAGGERSFVGPLKSAVFESRCGAGELGSRQGGSLPAGPPNGATAGRQTARDACIVLRSDQEKARDGSGSAGAEFRDGDLALRPQGAGFGYCTA